MTASTTLPLPTSDISLLHSAALRNPNTGSRRRSGGCCFVVHTGGRHGRAARGVDIDWSRSHTRRKVRPVPLHVTPGGLRWTSRPSGHARKAMPRCAACRRCCVRRSSGGAPIAGTWRAARWRRRVTAPASASSALTQLEHVVQRERVGRVQLLVAAFPRLLVRAPAQKARVVAEPARLQLFEIDLADQLRG